MRPPRIIIVGAFFVATVFLTFVSLRSSHAPDTITTASTEPQRAGILSFFAFRAPFSLFPPNAIITLTHDNTTAFLARPAAFGPSLPTEGLKGQLWIGSGFGDESIRQGPIAAGAEGELGCSDVKERGNGYSSPEGSRSDGGKLAKSNSAKLKSKSKSQKGTTDEELPFDEEDIKLEELRKKKHDPPLDDGTDDYLHHPLPASAASKSSMDKQATESSTDHADIQSIQEGAEIAGKVVLLSRGGCGFLEKVKWAQRRGAIALIVGDDSQGGPLIQMYARGDTSNVTIPSIFTSRTTAHLLSSLVRPGSFIEDTIDENGKPLLRVKHSDKRKGNGAGPTFTPTAPRSKTTVSPRKASKASHKKSSSRTGDKPMTIEKPGWFRSLFLGVGRANSESESSRPPSSGELDWVLVDDWKEEVEPKTKKVTAKPKPESTKGGQGKWKSGGDDFVIGVQDWRDPDLVGLKDGKAAREGLANSKSKGSSAALPKPGGRMNDDLPLRGGSITPGSGEYGKNSALSEATKEKDNVKDSSSGKSKGILTTIFGEDEEEVEDPLTKTNGASKQKAETQENDEYEGLWVTLTPTSGASPFFDTLLVLVVSPLVTLTVVYALLLIRSRIRRRRWRAPKSVVERLPVRTYQTIATPGNQSLRTPSPTSSSAATPLLQHSSSPTRPRPRSRTTTGIPEPGDLARVNASPLQVPVIPPRQPEHEKNASETSEWKKFMGKQIECVVCLEEYVDGVSRVMSLPCGHEFHVDCITPWLTTRRRTCPICKGDVVRSLARGSPSSPRYEAYHDDSDDDFQTQAAQTVNDSSSAALPIAGVIEEDVEQGGSYPSSRPRPRHHHPGSWRSMLASNISPSSRSLGSSQQQDRNR